MPATSEKEKIADAALPAPSDLNNGLTFPAFWDLPSEYEISESYLSSTTPRKHWCFLGKIISSNVLVRLTLEVEDKAGHRLLVAFHTDDRGAAFQDLCLQDHTIAVLYATQHTFAFSPPGLRLEEDAHIKVFPYSLDHMLEASGELFDKGRGKRCEVCRMVDAPLKKCAGCKGAWYCSKASKSSDWREHKQKCSINKDVQWFTRKNWESNSNSFFFPIRRKGW
ncbi:hypothetical protein J3A83DRAFT_4094374 [Scleroderma citrinum]